MRRRGTEKYKGKNMKAFNASLDSFKVQCNSVVFKFTARGAIIVPDELAPFIYNQFKERGVFLIRPSMTREEVKEAHRQALLEYLSGTLEERIRNYTSREDEDRKRGITIQRHPKFEEALRWKAEIIELLEMERPIEVELSFLDAERRKKLGFGKESIQEVKGDDLFADFESIEILEPSEDGFEEPSKKRGRPKTFKELDLQDLG